MEDFSSTSTSLGSLISDHFPKEKKWNWSIFLLKLELFPFPLVWKYIFVCFFPSHTSRLSWDLLAYTRRQNACCRRKKCIIFLALVYWYWWNQAQIYHQMSHLEDILIGTTNLSEQYKIHAVSQTWIHNRNSFHCRKWNLRVKPILLENLNLFYCLQLSDSQFM